MTAATANPSAAIPIELEAKLLVERESDLDALARLTRLGTYRLQPRPRQQLVSTYLDTADLALARHGVAVRLRACGDRWEATIKWAGSIEGELHDRPELTVPLAAPPRRAMGAIVPELKVYLSAMLAGRGLRPVLVTEIERRPVDVFDATGTHGLAEIALDRVVLRSPWRVDKRRECYGEVEIERKDGTAADVAAISALLRRGRALRPSGGTKLSRGLALLYGGVKIEPEPEAVRADDALDAAARKLVARHFHRLVAFDPGTRLGLDPEALHDMRVACRRLRAVLRIFDAAFPHDRQRQLRRDLSWLGKALGHVRDVDVQLERVRKFVERQRGQRRRRLQPYVEFLQRMRDERRPVLLKQLESRRYFRLLRQLETYAASTPGTEHGERLAAAGARAVRHAVRRLERRAARVGARPSAEELHAVRLRAKRVRYVCELLRPLTGAAGRRFVRRMVGIQDLLGAHNDAVVATAFAQSCRKDDSIDAACRVALEEFVEINEKHAVQARAEFHRTWKRFHRRKTDRGLAGLLARLE